MAEKMEPTNNFRELMAKYGANIFYDKWKVRARTDNLFLAGWPKNPEAELAMLEARMRKGLVTKEVVEAARQKISDATTLNVVEETEKASDKSTCAFKRVTEKDLEDYPTLKAEHLGAIYIESRQIKAGLREAATTLGKTQTDWGTKQVIQHAMFARGLEIPDFIFFYRDGRLMQPDGLAQMVAHIVGPQGPRSTIKIHEYVSPNTIFEFEIWRAASGNTMKIDERDLVNFLVLCENNGWGASRSQGFGRVEILSMEQTEKVESPIYEKRKPRAKGKKAEAEETEE